MFFCLEGIHRWMGRCSGSLWLSHEGRTGWFDLNCCYQPKSSTGSCCFIYELQLSFNLLDCTSTQSHQLSLQWRTATEPWPLLSLLLKSSSWFMTGTWMATCSVLEFIKGFKDRASISYHTYYLSCRFCIKPSREKFYNWTALQASIGVFGRTLRRKCVEINTILTFKFHPSLG